MNLKEKTVLGTKHHNTKHLRANDTLNVAILRHFPRELPCFGRSEVQDEVNLKIV